MQCILITALFVVCFAWIAASSQKWFIGDSSQTWFGCSSYCKKNNAEFKINKGENHEDIMALAKKSSVPIIWVNGPDPCAAAPNAKHDVECKECRAVNSAGQKYFMVEMKPCQGRYPCLCQTMMPLPKPPASKCSSNPIASFLYIPDGHKASLWIPDDNGKFAAVKVPELGHSGKIRRGIQLGDFNGDGLTDIMNYQDKSVNTWLNNGNNTFNVIRREHHLSEYSEDIIYVYSNSTVGDFNGDGKSDIIYFSFNKMMLEFMSLGNGTFDIKYLPTPEKDLSGVTSALHYVGDFNGDGNDDFLHVLLDFDYRICRTDLTISNGNETFRRIDDIKLGLKEHWNKNILTGDFNGDGNSDILFIQDYNHRSTYMFTSEYNMFSIKIKPAWSRFFHHLDEVLAGDFNGDEITDFIQITWSESGKVVETWLANGDGEFTMIKTNITFEYEINSKRFIGDFNGDGRSDFAHVVFESAIYLWFSNGDGRFGPQHTFPTRIRSYGSYDRFYIGNFARKHCFINV